MKQPKPEPVVTATACSLCGLNWDDHGDKLTPQTCIDLLRAELAKRPVHNWTVTNSPNTIYPTTTSTPLPWPGSTTICGTTPLIGEHGAEVFTASGSGTITPSYTIHVNAAGSSAKAGQQIVDAIKKYERLSGDSWRLHSVKNDGDDPPDMGVPAKVG